MPIRPVSGSTQVLPWWQQLFNPGAQGPEWSEEAARRQQQQIAAALAAPQGGNESNIRAGVRRAVNSMPDPMAWLRAAPASESTSFGEVAGNVAQVARNALDTPNARHTRATTEARPAGAAPWWARNGRPAPSVGQGSPAPAAVAALGSAPNGARGWRNNNPGNLEDGQFARSQPGYAGTDGRFARFNTPEAGIAAQERLLRGSPGYFGGGQRSVEQIVGRYLGNGSDNSPASRANYIAYVSNALGVQPNQPLDATSTSRMAAAMREFENGQQRGPSGAPGTQPGFEPYTAFADQALAELDRSQAAAMTPFSTTVSRTPMPQLPTPTDLAAPDFSAGNAAFDRAAPVNPYADPVEKTRRLRQGFFQGMAQSLLTINPSQPIGLGQLLLRMGAGSLSGRMSGEEAVRERSEQYDRLLQQYELQRSQRNDRQAEVTANTLNQNIQADNQHAQQQAVQNINQWARDNSTDIQGGSVVTRRALPDGNQQINVTPIPALVAAEYGRHRASIMAGAASPAQSNAQWSWQLANNDYWRERAMAIQAGGSVGAEAVGSLFASAIVPSVESGRWRAWFGETAMQIENEMFHQLAIDPIRYRQDPAYQRNYREQFNSALAERLTVEAMGNPQWGARILQTYQGQAARAVERYRGSRSSTTTRTDSRGRTTSSTSNVFGPTD